jgi:hypothetical protein
MLQLLQIVTLVVAAIAMALSLSHALEYPGKLRLGEKDYRVVQTIYYPGFTLGGASEPAAIGLTFVLLLATPASMAFWLTLIALIVLVGVQVVFWLVTQPVNKHWMKGEKLGDAGKTFFDVGGNIEGDWTALRDRWEHSHIARAALATIAFVLLLAAVTRDA